VRSTSAVPSVSSPAQSDFSGPTADFRARRPEVTPCADRRDPWLEERREASDAATQAIINCSERSIDDTIATAVAVPDQADKALRLLEELSQLLQTRPSEPNID
jgi:hypothetical protein